MSVVVSRSRIPSKVKEVSKKDVAFELFGQGKTPDSPEVEALGLKPDTAKKYFRLWQKS